MKLPAVLRRLPTPLPPKPEASGLFGHASEDFPSLASDLQRLDEELTPAFEEADAAALYYSNRYRLENLIVILGGAILSILSARMPQGGGDASHFLALLRAVLALLIAWSTVRSARVDAQERAITKRLVAEQLKREYFLFLARTGDYVEEDRRLVSLRTRIASILAEGQRV